MSDQICGDKQKAVELTFQSILEYRWSFTRISTEACGAAISKLLKKMELSIETAEQATMAIERSNKKSEKND